MPAFLEPMLADEALLLTLGLFSVIFFLLTLIIIPWLILRIPEDYFAAEERHSFLDSKHHPVLRLLLMGLKNFIGLFFVVLGILLLVLPGQGLLTMLLGIILIDFPGKYRLERWLVSRPAVLRSINWLRKKGKRAPITL